MRGSWSIATRGLQLATFATIAGTISLPISAARAQGIVVTPPSAVSPAAQAAPSAPAPAPADPNPVWEPALVFQPMILSLTSPDFVPGAVYTPNCDEEAKYSGNSAGPLGLPVVIPLGYQLSPRLSVLAFSRLGCPVTAGLGAAAAYTVPITRTVAFSWSASTYAMPQAILRGTALKGLLRADVLWQSSDGRVTRTGIEAMSVRGATSSAKIGATYGFSF